MQVNLDLGLLSSFTVLISGEKYLLLHNIFSSFIYVMRTLQPSQFHDISLKLKMAGIFWNVGIYCLGLTLTT